MQLAFEPTADRQVPAIGRATAGGRLRLPTPIHCSYLSGGIDALTYATVSRRSPHEWLATRAWTRDGLRLQVDDTYGVREDAVRVTRLRVVPLDRQTPAAVRLQLGVLLPPAPAGGVRYCAPAVVYSPDQHATPGAYVFNDACLAYPLALAWTADGDAVALLRATLAGYPQAFAATVMSIAPTNRRLRPAQQPCHLSNRVIGGMTAGSLK